MLRIRVTSSLGFALLLGVLVIAVTERKELQISYFDWHAVAVVFGGVIGSLLIALEGSVLILMLQDWISVLFARDKARESLRLLKAETAKIESAWREGRRSEVLNLLQTSPCEEVRAAADALIQHLQGPRLRARFESLQAEIQDRLVPQIEGWDMVARLAPAFGIVGTVAGMVQLFRNMASESGNLGGAMAMALLATLYGILVGTALGGPMSTRLNQILSESMGVLDLLEAQVAGLVDEDRLKRRQGEPSV